MEPWGGFFTAHKLIPECKTILHRYANTTQSYCCVFLIFNTDLTFKILYFLTPGYDSVEFY